jgi:hypothetical protein
MQQIVSLKIAEWKSLAKDWFKCVIVFRIAKQYLLNRMLTKRSSPLPLSRILLDRFPGSKLATNPYQERMAMFRDDPI